MYNDGWTLGIDSSTILAWKGHLKLHHPLFKPFLKVLQQNKFL